MKSDAELADAFLEYLWLRERLAQNTLDAYRRDLAKLSAALAAGGQSLANAEGEALAAAVHAGGAASTQARMLSAAKRFYGWLHETEQRADNPCAALKAARQPQRLPVLVSEAQIDALLAAPDTADPFGLRDKALLELVYATGLRASEAVGLTLNDVGLERGIVHTVGKGGKPRIVPLGAEAAHWLERYLAEARGQILKGRRCDALFVGNKKGAISRQLAWQIVRRYTARPAPRLCHPYAQPRRRFARAAAAAGPCRHHHHPDLHPCGRFAAAGNCQTPPSAQLMPFIPKAA